MRSRSSADLAGRCPRCLLRVERCLCAEFPVERCGIRFVVLRHALEAAKATNTARLASVALDSVEIREHGGEGRLLEVTDLDPDTTMLVFPGGSPGPLEHPLPERFVLLDGNWNQAKRMLGRFAALQRLPRLTLPSPQVAPVRLRRGTTPEQLSTIEAIAGVLRACGDAGGAERLERLYRTFVQRVRAARGLPTTG